MTNNERGRSMVEMLGVLAIIGVLSVGGIAGYSSAMNKFKINKTVEQLYHVTQNLKNLCANDACETSLMCSQDNYAPYQREGCSALKKLNLVPDDMWNQTSEYLVTPFNTPVNINFSSETISFLYRNVPKDLCIALSSFNHDFFISGIKYFSIVPRLYSCSAYSKEYGAESEAPEEYWQPLSFEKISECCEYEDKELLLVF